MQTVFLGALTKALWSHVNHCKDVAAMIARMDARLERLTQDIGTHDTGLRGQVHHVANTADAMEKRLYLMENSKGMGR